MSAERKQVLDLLSEGKVTSEEAGLLLDRIGPSLDGPPVAGAPRPKVRFMCVRVDTTEGDAVNVRIPLALVRGGIKLTAMMPKSAAEAMAKNGVDFSQLSTLAGDDLIAALEAMEIDVVSNDGDRVKISCE